MSYQVSTRALDVRVRVYFHRRPFIKVVKNLKIIVLLANKKSPRDQKKNITSERF